MQIKKKKLHKKTRMSLMVVLTLLLAFLSYGAYHVYRTPLEVEKSIPTYSYRHKGEMKYLVYLKPNSIFNETIQGPGKTYFSKMVDKIVVYLNYQFSADKDASLKCAYDVEAIIEAPEMWQKSYLLVPLTEIHEEGKIVSFQKEFPVNLAYFNDVLKSINEEVGISARSPVLKIKSNIYVRSTGEDGSVKDDLNPLLSIPLTTGDFSVGGELSPQKEGSLTKTEWITDPAIKSMKISQLYSLATSALVLVILFILLLLLTENKVVAVDERKAIIDIVLKKYKERMVMVENEPAPAGNATVICLNSMEDLVKTADELGKIILYSNPVDTVMFPTYYVFDGLTVYKHTLNKKEFKIKTPRGSHPQFESKTGDFETV